MSSPLTALRTSWRTSALLIVMLLLVVTWASFHGPIERRLAVALVLRADNPNPEFFTDAASKAADPLDFLLRCWATGKVAHRYLVASFLKDNAAAHSPWVAGAESLLLACTVDADASVREIGLAALDQLHSPRLFEAAATQLNDLDPLVRRFGLEYLRKSVPRFAVPLLVRALDDPDLRNVTAAENALMRFSGQDFGVRASQALQIEDNAAAEATNSANLVAIRLGVERRKQWWREHQNEYAASVSVSTPEIPPAFPTDPRPVAPDFALPDLNGKKLKLSDFRGKVVLVNFWATWCTACLKEVPDLIALYQKMAGKAALLGVSLDGVPDEDGDTPGEEGESHKKNGATPKASRAKVERAVKLRNINYPVMLDPQGVAGGQYNGGELPTTVIFDVEGRVRRRFIGERNLAVFEAMIAEASKPPLPKPVLTSLK